MMKSQGPRRIAAWLATSILAVGVVAAHGGEDHGPPAPAAGTAPQSVFSLTDTSDTFELVAEHHRLETGKPQRVYVYLSDFQTNRPVSGVSIRFDLSGPATVTIVAKPTDEPGVYEAEVTWPADGEYQAAVTITSKATTDQLTLGPFRVGTRFYVPPTIASSDEGSRRLLIASLLVTVLAIGELLVFMGVVSGGFAWSHFTAAGWSGSGSRMEQVQRAIRVARTMFLS